MKNLLTLFFLIAFIQMGISRTVNLIESDTQKVEKSIQVIDTITVGEYLKTLDYKSQEKGGVAFVQEHLAFSVDKNSFKEPFLFKDDLFKNIGNHKNANKKANSKNQNLSVSNPVDKNSFKELFLFKDDLFKTIDNHKSVNKKANSKNSILSVRDSTDKYFKNSLRLLEKPTLIFCNIFPGRKINKLIISV